MGNNPILYSDQDGDFIAQAVGGIVGGVMNVANNWDKVLANPVSAFGYAATGVGAGVVATLPGGVAASRAILAAGNVATDFATGNLPEFNSFGDFAGYAANTTLDAFSTAGTSKAIGKLAQQSLKKAALKAGQEVAEEGAFSLIGDEALGEMTAQWYGQEVGQGVYVTIKGKAVNWGARAAGNIGINTVSSSLGIHGNSINNPNPSQVYHHTFSDGNGNFKTYTGVGDVEGKRAWQSVSRIEKQNPGWRLYDSKTTIAPNRKTALMTEQIMINQSRRLNGANSVINKRNTGKRLLKKLNKIF